jgi:pimeloyl-ACP methyl ester carboxylesterase
MSSRRELLTALIAVVCVLASPSVFAVSGDVGVVLLHGKGGVPTGYIRALAWALQDRGHLVATPEMPWSKGRIYDASIEESMAEIDLEVKALRQKGAKLVIVGGQSLGANVAIAYAASRARVDGIVVLAPGHNPELPGFARRIGADLSKARMLIEAGKGKEKSSFSDLNQGQSSQISATPEVYVSWFDPQGLAVMPRSAAAIKSSTPLLFIVGSGDRSAPTQDYIFDKAPAHVKSKFVMVNADHLHVPSAAIEDVAAWLVTLTP